MICALRDKNLNQQQAEQLIAEKLEVEVKLVRQWLCEIKADIQTDQVSGVKHISLSDSEYPDSLKHLKSPPLVLSCRGRLAALRNQGLGVVGSRNPTELTVSWLQTELGKVLLDESTKKSWSLISGGAHGVDLCSHLVALNFGIPSVVVLPSGIRNISPQRCRELSSVIAERGGVLVSCFAPNQRPGGYLYHMRNEVLVALSSAVVIAQAGHRSGTMVSAKFASDLGKPLFVLPGHALDPGYQGSLELIRDGANMLIKADDLIAEMTNLVSSGFESSTV